jgi:beta-lactamase regulating signal transducer with metallopeptidase domain
VTFGTLGTALAYRITDMNPKLFIYLIDPAIRSLALGALVGLVLLLTRAKSISLRLSAWKIVVCAALVMPVLAAGLPPLQITLPFANRFAEFSNLLDLQTKLQPAPASPVAQPQIHTSARSIAKPSPSPVPMQAQLWERARVPASSTSRRIEIPWLKIAETVYLGFAAFLAFRFALGWFLSQKLRQTSAAIEERAVSARFASIAASFGLQEAPALAASERLAVPLTCGVVRPAVLLPAEWRDWDAQKLEAVMAHELSHVARRDALTERLALVHRIFFWFSPLAWWLPRHLADLAEEASDQAALAAGTEPSKYAEILLGFLNDLSCGAKRVDWQGVAMAQAGRAEKRLDRILNGRMIMTSELNKTLIATVVFSSVPVVLLAATLQPRLLGHQIELAGYPSARAQQQAPPQPPAAPAPASLATAPVASAPPTAATAPIPRAVPAPAAAPLAVVVATSTVEAMPAPLAQPVIAAYPAPRVTPFVVPMIQQAPPTPPAPSYSYSISTDGDDSYAIISGKSSTMSGTFGRRNFKELESLHQKLNSDFIWFERDGKSYIITDPEIVKRAEAAFQAQSMLGEKEGELGERIGSLGELQGMLGEQQGALGEQMGDLQTEVKDIQIQMPDISNELQSVREMSKELSQTLSDKDMEELRANMDKMRVEVEKASKQIAEAQVHSGAMKSLDTAAMDEAISKAQASMSQEIDKVAAEQSRLGEQQEALSQAQEELSKEQEKSAAQAQKEIKALIDDAISKGIAKPAPKQ